MTIKNKIRKTINSIFNLLDVSIERKSYIQRLITNEEIIDNYGLLKYLQIPEGLKFLENLSYSKSQYNQDLFVLSQLGFKQNGYYVEFGACDGMEMSNTYLLEKRFNWLGILAEPAKKYHKNLEKNRDSLLEKDCVWEKSNELLSFNETDIGGLSTLDSFTKNDKHAINRKKGNKYFVKTISLEDLLKKHNAPKIIDYLSIDTEGSEYQILKNFNFDEYSFRIITIEHNFTKQREKIFNLLKEKGYKRKFEDISNVDDWYILEKKK